MDLIRSSTTVLATGSSPAVGSSYMIHCSTSPFDELSWTMARANATRFFIPPESSDGYRSSTPDNPTLASASAMHRSISSSGSAVCSYSTNPTFSFTLRLSNSAPD
mmetsp:Transcript_10930/g.30550  ORF Transcript_10930/g.30550 Transcript_10930/m.30550 type:complete len:106 (+) Transcript_10930:223-540(+)